MDDHGDVRPGELTETAGSPTLPDVTTNGDAKTRGDELCESMHVHEPIRLPSVSVEKGSGQRRRAGERQGKPADRPVVSGPLSAD